jgi:hypothetical protein
MVASDDNGCDGSEERVEIVETRDGARKQPAGGSVVRWYSGVIPD